MGDREQLRAYIHQRFLPDEDPSELDDSTALVTTGIVSSLAVLELVSFIEATFKIQLRQEDLDPRRLDSVAAILTLVEARRGSG